MFSHLTEDFFGNKQSRAIAIAFISFGLLFGTWATFIPFVKQKFGFNDANLGLLLLLMPFGSMTTNLIGAWLVEKFGMRKTTLWGMVFMALSFLIPLNAVSVYQLAIGLYLCGASISITNIGMNIGVTNIEADLRINIISTCHGMFSLGLMFGSLFASISYGSNFNPAIHMLIVSSLVVLFSFYIKPTIKLVKNQNKNSTVKQKFSMPKGPLSIMILIGICGNITEGTMVDWTSVYMRDIVKSNSYFIGWGLTSYSLFMGLGRLFGDKIIPSLGPNRVLTMGGLIAAFGLSFALLFPMTWTAILGFAFVGAGISCVSPILYGSAARLPGLENGAGIAIMNTFAMGGFLAGPVVIGLLSEATSLPIALSIIIVLAIMWALLSIKARLY